MPIPEHGNFGKEHDDHAVDYGLPYFSKLYNPPNNNQQGFNRQVQSTWVVPAHFFCLKPCMFPRTLAHKTYHASMTLDQEI
jgi:hypothetical protein